MGPWPNKKGLGGHWRNRAGRSSDRVLLLGSLGDEVVWDGLTVGTGIITAEYVASASSDAAEASAVLVTSVVGGGVGVATNVGCKVSLNQRPAVEESLSLYGL